MYRFRRYGFGVLLVLFALSVSAFQSDEPAEIHLWHHWSGERQPLLQAVVNTFMEENPDIRVVETLHPTSGYKELLLTAIAGGSAPDVVMFHSRDLQAFAAQGALTQLDDRWAAADVSSDFWYPGYFESNLYQGHLYGLPLTEGSRYIVYNTEMLQAAGLDADNFPTTWPEFLEAAKTLTKLDDSGQVDVAGYAANLDPRQFLRWLVANGQSSIYSDDLKTAQVNTQQGVETFEFMKSLVNDTLGGYQNMQAYQTSSSALDVPIFAAEKAAMAAGETFQFFVFAQANPDLDYHLANMPGGPSGDGPVTVLEPDWSYVIPTGSKHEEAAWRLLYYLTVGDGARDFLIAQNRASPAVSYSQLPHYSENVPRYDEYLEVTTPRRPLVTSPVHIEALATLGEALERMVIEDQSPQEAADWANNEVQKLLDEFWAAQ